MGLSFCYLFHIPNEYKPYFCNYGSSNHYPITVHVINVSLEFIQPPGFPSFLHHTVSISMILLRLNSSLISRVILFSLVQSFVSRPCLLTHNIPNQRVGSYECMEISLSSTTFVTMGNILMDICGKRLLSLTLMWKRKHGAL